MSSFNKIKPPLVTNTEGGTHPINQVKDYLLYILNDFGFNSADFGHSSIYPK